MVRGVWRWEMTAHRRIIWILLIFVGAWFLVAMYIAGVWSLAMLMKSDPIAVFGGIAMAVLTLFLALFIFLNVRLRLVGMDAELIRYNERYKALATFCDNASLGVFGGSVAQFFANEGSNLLVTLGVLLGIAFLTAGWHIRGLIQSETVSE